MSPADSQPSPLARVLEALDAGLDATRERLFSLLSVPSVSTDPAHNADCRRAAEWVAADLRASGFTAAVRETKGQPVVLAHHPGPRGNTGGNAPHLLYYGHYDVQPPDPVALWKSPPFSPALVNGPHGKRIVARGAVDDKGQVMTFLAAFRAWHDATGSLPVRATVLIEGEEEIGSPNLEPFLVAERDALAADVAVISDTSMWNIDTPALTTRLRGMVYTEIVLKGPNRDLHSGMYGGSALNPINALTHILGGLHDDAGRVRIPDFYDDVRPLDPATARQWESLGFDEKAFLGGIGLSHPAGEGNFTGLQRLWARPTADLNGIWGGYAGPGSKTVIPSEAAAKLSFRLVPDQDPEKIVAGLRRFLADRAPADATVDLKVFGSTPAIEVRLDSSLVRAARVALADEYGKEPVMMGCGGSIPVVESLARALGINSLLMGFGLADDQVHSPNEKFELRCLYRGARAHARLLGALGRSS
ncbi:MAG TPA: M20/M25/M40 family metallo-hydrolase [Acetobacteraceae bacterium]|nr:M20/M25/M40 family metallo-hydrolase [Acetobacteraceae bacterium]